MQICYFILKKQIFCNNILKIRRGRIFLIPVLRKKQLFKSNYNKKIIPLQPHNTKKIF